MTLKVGLVGKRAGHFASGLQSVPGVTIAGLCELDQEGMAQLADRAAASGAQRVTSYDALLEQIEPDLVVLGTPMHLHAPQAIQALERGVHVLSEVPAAVDLKQCAELVAAVQRSRASYMMAENYCYMRHTMLVRNMARGGLFGECYFAEGEYVHDVKHLHHFPDGSLTWRATWQVGKAGCTYGTHSLGPTLEFFGPESRVVSVSCVGSGVHTDSRHPHDDTSIMLCQLNTGGLIKVRLDMMSNRPHEMAYYALQGTNGCYEAPRGFGDDHKLWLAERGEDPAAPKPRQRREWRSLWDYADAFLPEDWRSPPDEAMRAGHGGGDYFMARDFVQAALDDRPPPIDVYRAMDFTVPGLVSEQSIAQGGAPLPVPDFRLAE